MMGVKTYILIAADVLFAAASVALRVPPLFAACMLVWLIAVEYCTYDPLNRAALLLFLLSFFIFLLGSEFVVQYLDYPQELMFSDAINRHTYLALLLSVTGILAGYAGSSLLVGTWQNSEQRTQEAAARMLLARHYAVWGMCVTILPYFAESAATVLYVLKNGYLAYYVSYSSPLPSLIVRLSECFTLFLFMYLASLPDKKDCYLPLGIYLLQGVAMLLSGRRIYFGMAVFVCLVYMIIRQKLKPEERWMTKKVMAIIIAAVPVIIILLYMYRFVRYGKDVEGTGFKELFLGFFEQQGFSINVLKYAKYYEGDDLGVTSLFHTLKFLRKSALTRWWTDFPVSYYKTRDLNSALHTNSLGSYIIYCVSPKNYAKGLGYGTSFVAELFHDGGYLLVALGSCFYGVLLERLFNARMRGIWRGTFALLMLEQFIILPRYGADVIFRPFYSAIVLVVVGFLAVVLHNRLRFVE